MKFSSYSQQTSRESAYSLIIIFTTIGILALDLLGTAGFAIWVLYILPVLFGIWLFSKKSDGYLLTVLSSVFIIMGFYFSGKRSEGEIAFINRLMFIGVLWIASFLLISKRHAERQVQAAYKKLGRITSELVILEERERKSLASILHDKVGQTLAAIKLRIDCSSQIPRTSLIPSRFIPMAR